MARRARSSLASFAKQAWHIIEPGAPLEWNWHLDAVCRHMEAVADGRIRRLAINVPPGSMKSSLCSVLFPAWMWTRCPSWRGIFGSYAKDIVLRDAARTRDIVTSDWYRENFMDGWMLSYDQRATNYFVTTQQGFRLCVTSGGGTGKRGNACVIDDPIEVENAFSSVTRNKVNRWLDQTMSNRLLDMRHGAIVMIMQRLHEDDPTGHVLAQGGWDHLRIQAEYDPNDKCKCESCQKYDGGTSIGYRDPRTEIGQLFFESRFPKTVLESERRIKGPAGYEGQYQQSPRPMKGAIFQRDWWQYESQETMDARQYDFQALSLDCAFKDNKNNSRVAFGVFGKKGPNIYVRKVVVGHMGFVATRAKFRQLIAEYPNLDAKYVEDKANGTAIMDELEKEIGGIIAIEADTTKEARAHAISSYVEAGNVVLPSDAPWVGDFVEELTAFPFGAYDDQVDMFTQAIRRLVVAQTAWFE